MITDPQEQPGGSQRNDRTSWRQVAFRQRGTVVVPHDGDRSLSAGRACMVSADGLTAEEPPFDGVVAVASEAHV